MSKVKEALSTNPTNSTNSRNYKEGLPKEAFAIIGDPYDSETWKLPHHTKAIMRALNSMIRYWMPPACF